MEGSRRVGLHSSLWFLFSFLLRGSFVSSGRLRRGPRRGMRSPLYGIPRPFREPATRGIRTPRSTTGWLSSDTRAVIARLPLRGNNGSGPDGSSSPGRRGSLPAEAVRARTLDPDRNRCSDRSLAVSAILRGQAGGRGWGASQPRPGAGADSSVRTGLAPPHSKGGRLAVKREEGLGEIRQLS